MKNKLKNTAAAFGAAGLMMFTMASPIFASEITSQTVFYDYDEAGLPKFDKSLMSEKPGLYDITEGQYYVWKYRVADCDQPDEEDEFTYHIEYGIFKIVKVYEEETWYGTERCAILTNIKTGDTYWRPLRFISLYNFSQHQIESAEF
ncbi:MAG: hypothetical protein HUJ54_10885 [Erysipelotrichaceae bacterium]|nr:hypothetical protein [Erysipelotrichaceae bacterium]